MEKDSFLTTQEYLKSLMSEAKIVYYSDLMTKHKQEASGARMISLF